MKLYDFQEYARRRERLRSADQVQNLRCRLNEPGIVIELKAKVEDHLILHREVQKLVAT